jgi:hypothetical protein
MVGTTSASRVAGWSAGSSSVLAEGTTALTVAIVAPVADTGGIMAAGSISTTSVAGSSGLAAITSTAVVTAGVDDADASVAGSSGPDRHHFISASKAAMSLPERWGPSASAASWGRTDASGATGTSAPLPPACGAGGASGSGATDALTSRSMVVATGALPPRGSLALRSLHQLPTMAEAPPPQAP